MIKNLLASIAIALCGATIGALGYGVYAHPDQWAWQCETILAACALSVVAMGVAAQQREEWSEAPSAEVAGLVDALSEAQLTIRDLDQENFRLREQLPEEVDSWIDRFVELRSDDPEFDAKIDSLRLGDEQRAAYKLHAKTMPTFLVTFEVAKDNGIISAVIW